MQAISEAYKLSVVEASTASGQTQIDSATVDMAGHESVLFFVKALAITAGGAQSIKCQGGEESDGSDAADLEGTSITIADDDDNQVFAIEVFRPRHRYVRVRILRATQDSAFSEIWALQGPAKEQPVTNTVADTLTLELHSSPAAGTA